jgi:biotin operon repressor
MFDALDPNWGPVVEGWQYGRPGIVALLGELEQAVMALDAPRRAALEAIRASRMVFESAPPPGPTSVSPPTASPPAPPPPTAEAVGKPATAEDEKLAGIVRRLTENACRVLAYLLTENATSYRNLRRRQRIADELVLSIDDVNTVRDELKKAGVPIESEPGAKGGWWLTPDGVRLAEIVARESQPAVTGKPDGSNKPGANRG